MVILKKKKKKKKSFTAVKVLFLENLDIENVLVSKNISSGKKNYKNFIGYLYNDFKIRPLHIMLPKASAYVSIYIHICIIYISYILYIYIYTYIYT